MAALVTEPLNRLSQRSKNHYELMTRKHASLPTIVEFLSFLYDEPIHNSDELNTYFLAQPRILWIIRNGSLETTKAQHVRLGSRSGSFAKIVC